jgi:putative adhesin
MRNETFQTPEPPELRINLPSGDVRVQTSADATETYVELSGPNEEDARIEQRRDQIVIEIERKKLFGMRGDYTLLVTAPFGTRVDSNFASADFEGVGRFGNVSIDTASGEVALEAVDGRLEINTASGDVRADFVGGDIRINSASGDVEVGEAEHDAKIRTASGDVEIRSAVRGKIDVTSASGDVEVGIRQGSKVFIDASSMSGDMSSELDMHDAPVGESDGPNIDFRARTMSGDVTVRRA